MQWYVIVFVTKQMGYSCLAKCYDYNITIHKPQSYRVFMQQYNSRNTFNTVHFSRSCEKFTDFNAAEAFFLRANKKVDKNPKQVNKAT